MNIIFAGTPHFALPSLEAVWHSSHDLQAVYTQPDRPAGRGHTLQASPVKQWAVQHKLPIYQPINFKLQASIDELKALQPDLLIVIAYGLILPQAVLDIPKYGCVNVHASLLPRWRGASPIQQALLHGDAETGVTIMQMDAGMDTGDMLTKVTCPIDANETAGSLHDKLAHLATAPLVNMLNQIENQCVVPTPQDKNGVTYAPKIVKNQARIHWAQSAVHIERQIRAFNPWPIAFTQFDQNIIRIHQAHAVNEPHSEEPGTILASSKDGLLVATGEGCLLIKRIQFPGGKVIPFSDYLNAHSHVLPIHGMLT